MKILGIILIALQSTPLVMANPHRSQPQRTTVECFPQESDKTYRLQKVTVKSMSFESHQLEIFRSGVPVESYDVEYGDDVGFFFYTSADEQIQLEYEASIDGERTSGTLRVNWRSGSGINVPVICFEPR